MQNRLSGIVALALGLAIIFILIPIETEPVDYGWLKPATLPLVAAVIISVGGLLHLFFPKGEVQLALTDSIRALAYLFAGLLGLWGMKQFGFKITAPLMMLGIMLAIGERRWLWLLGGSVLLPGTIWFCIEFLLERPLP